MKPTLPLLLSDPPTANAIITERTYVLRICDGAADLIDVKYGASMNHRGADLIEIFGDLGPEDQFPIR